MKNFALLLIFLANSASVFAQINNEVPTVDLGNVYENNTDSVLVKFFLPQPISIPVSVEEFVGFPFYGDTVVALNKTNFWLSQTDSTTVWMKASPEHNVAHKGVLLAKCKRSPFGTFVIPYEFQGKYSNAYYNTTENKTEASLRSELSSIISTSYTQLSYNVARDNMYATLDNNNGVVECVYTGRTATFNSRSGANANSFNCEHTFPQSLFNKNLPMRSDIHHLFSTDVTANGQRGNYPFAVVSNPTWQQGGSKKGSGIFEPRDAQKGATARAMMYFVLRYQDYANFYAGQKSILRQWHTAHPPTVAEKTRNDGIYALQNNRNPFVDYPQFAERITNLVGATTAAQDPRMYISTDSVFLLSSAIVQSDLVYTVNVINYGNTPISISNMALSTSVIEFAGTANDTTILPGEYLPIFVKYNPKNTQVLHESLTFSTDVAGQTQITIPINSLSFLHLDEENWQPVAKITNAQIELAPAIGKVNWQILDVAGRTVQQGVAQGKAILELSSLKTGAYLLQIVGENGQHAEKFVRINN